MFFLDSDTIFFQSISDTPWVREQIKVQDVSPLLTTLKKVSIHFFFIVHFLTTKRLDS